MSAGSISFLIQLEQLIESRKSAAPDSSYTASLFAAGRSRIAQKVAEEGVELALASVEAERGRIVSESADLLYHLLVLLRDHDIDLADVARELEQRSR